VETIRLQNTKLTFARPPGKRSWIPPETLEGGTRPLDGVSWFFSRIFWETDIRVAIRSKIFSPGRERNSRLLRFHLRFAEPVTTQSRLQEGVVTRSAQPL